MKESFQPKLFGEAVLPAMRLRELMHFPVESALAFGVGMVIPELFSETFSAF